MELVGLRRTAPDGVDVAKSAQAVALLRAKTQKLRQLIAFARRRLGRLGVEAEQRGCFDSKQLRLQSAMATHPRRAKRGLDDVESPPRLPGRERLAEQRARQRGEILRVNPLRSFESGFQQWDGGLEFPVERKSVP